MASGLKKLLRDRPTGDDITRCVEELSTDGPRGTAALACALLEDVLRVALVAKMVTLSKDEHDKMFTGTGPLSSLWAKTQMAYALGIIGPKTRHDLDSIRDIRNALAHTVLKVGFDTPEVAALCKGLHTLSTIEKSHTTTLSNPRSQYVAVTRALMLRLVGTFAKDTVEIPPELLAKE